MREFSTPRRERGAPRFSTQRKLPTLEWAERPAMRWGARAIMAMADASMQVRTARPAATLRFAPTAAATRGEHAFRMAANPSPFAAGAEPRARPVLVVSRAGRPVSANVARHPAPADVATAMARASCWPDSRHRPVARAATPAGLAFPDRAAPMECAAVVVRAAAAVARTVGVRPHRTRPVDWAASPARHAPPARRAARRALSGAMQHRARPVAARAKLA